MVFLTWLQFEGNDVNVASISISVNVGFVFFFSTLLKMDHKTVLIACSSLLSCKL